MPPADAIQCVPLEVTPRRNESPERMVRRFSKIVRNDGIIREFLSKRYYEKPSRTRRRKKAVSKYRSGGG